MHGKTVLAILVLGSFRSGCGSAGSDILGNTRRLILFCVVTNEKVPQETYLITGEQSNDKLTFDEGDYVYVNKGAKQGAKVGDEFLVIRPAVLFTGGIDWTKWQFPLFTKWVPYGQTKAASR